MANSIVHFEIFAENVERARKFYEQVFGWTFEVGGPPDFYFISTGPETDRGLTHGLMARRRGPMGQGELNSVRVTIAVRSITAMMAAIKAAGGTIRGSMADIPHVGKVAEFTDTEGNIACVMEYVPGHVLAAT
jgi:predicted enzyme related to lactoylglutathione lyase